MERAWRAAGVQDISLTLYPRWSHTDPILEAVMDNDDQFHKDLTSLLEEWTNLVPQRSPIRGGRMCPHCMIVWARYFNAFQ